MKIDREIKCKYRNREVRTARTTQSESQFFASLKIGLSPQIVANTRSDVSNIVSTAPK